MLCEAVLVDREDTCRIKREVVRLVEGDALRSTVDVHTLHRTVTLHVYPLCIYMRIYHSSFTLKYNILIFHKRFDLKI